MMENNQHRHIHRTILKQGYLYKLSESSKATYSFKPSRRRWFVLCVINHREPCLQSYHNNDDVHKMATNKQYSLRSCRHVMDSPPIRKHHHVVTLVMEHMKLHLAAPDCDEKNKWMLVINRCLLDYGVTKTNREGNLYQAVERRDPRSPLPVTPTPEADSRSVTSASVSRSQTTHVNATSTAGVVAVGNSNSRSRTPRDSLPSSTATADSRNVHVTRAASDVGQRYDRQTNTQTQQHGNSNDSTQRYSVDATPSAATPSAATPSAATPSAATPSAAVAAGSQQNHVIVGHSIMAESVRRRQTEVALPSYTERDTSIAAPAYTEYLEPQEQEEIYEAAWQPSRSSSSPTTPLMSAQAPTPATPASPPHTLPPFNFSTPTNTSAAARRSSAGVPNTPMSPISLNFGSVPSTPVGATAAPGDESGVFEDDLTVVPPKMIEALGLHDPDQEQDGEQGATARPLYPPVDDDPVVGWNAPPPTNMDAPPPYIPRRMLSVGGEKPLKIDQVDQLKREMTHPGGIKITFRRVDVFRTLACVDCFGSVWIVGWMQKLRPFLSRALHIGDQVISVNGHVVENARMVHKTVKYTPEHEKVVLIVKRLPHAKVYAITRTEQRQDIGVVCKGVTAEILAVEPFGLAAIAGLPTKATSVDGTTACSWWITEVNHRSLNLFYKNNEVQTRLNAVGLDLSFVVQPVDLIAALKKQMKAAYKNYKEFIVQ